MFHFFRAEERPRFAVVEPRLRDYYYDIAQWAVTCWKTTQNKESFPRSCMYMGLRTGHTDLFYIIYLQAYSKNFFGVFFFLQAKVMISEWVTVCLDNFSTFLQPLQLVLSKEANYIFTSLLCIFYHITLLCTTVLYFNSTLFYLYLLH